MEQQNYSKEILKKLFEGEEDVMGLPFGEDLCFNSIKYGLGFRAFFLGNSIETKVKPFVCTLKPFTDDIDGQKEKTWLTMSGIGVVTEDLSLLFKAEFDHGRDRKSFEYQAYLKTMERILPRCKHFNKNTLLNLLLVEKKQLELEDDGMSFVMINKRQDSASKQKKLSEFLKQVTSLETHVCVTQ